MHGAALNRVFQSPRGSKGSSRSTEKRAIKMGNLQVIYAIFVGLLLFDKHSLWVLI